MGVEIFSNGVEIFSGEPFENFFVGGGGYKKILGGVEIFSGGAEVFLVGVGLRNFGMG